MCCTKESTQVEITIGGIIEQPHIRRLSTKRESSRAPVLDITIEFVYGFVKNNDFVYLTKTESKELPDRMQKLDQNMIFKLEGSSFADNYGKAYIPLSFAPGSYKIHYCRRKLEFKTSGKVKLRNLHAADFDILGTSESFILNKTEENKSECSVSFCSQVDDTVKQEVCDTDQTKLQNQASLNMTESINSSSKVYQTHSTVKQNTWQNNTNNNSSIEDSLTLSKSVFKKGQDKLLNANSNADYKYLQSIKENMNVANKPKSR